MSKAKIIEHGGVYLDLSKVKCFRIKNKTTLVVEYKTQIEYVLNPYSEMLEKEYVNDTTEIEFLNETVAKTKTEEWIGSWKKCVR